jgi:hypothetical protein
MAEDDPLLPSVEARGCKRRRDNWLALTVYSIARPLPSCFVRTAATLKRTSAAARSLANLTAREAANYFRHAG